MKKNQVIRIIVGVITGGIDTWWTIGFSILLYKYHSGKYLFLFMFPDWVVYLNIIVGLIGLFVSWRMIIGALKIWHVFLIHLFLYAVCMCVILWGTL